MIILAIVFIAESQTSSIGNTSSECSSTEERLTEKTSSSEDQALPQRLVSDGWIGPETSPEVGPAEVERQNRPDVGTGTGDSSGKAGKLKRKTGRGQSEDELAVALQELAIGLGESDNDTVKK